MPGRHDARIRLVRAAEELLIEGGVGAASPAAVAVRAGASKMSIYRHFSGKDDLVAAALADREPRHRGWLLGPASSTDWRASVLEVFDRVAQVARARSFMGCPYVNARLEVRDQRHPVGSVVLEHKRLVVKELSRRLRKAGISRPEQLARTLLLLLDGATMHAVLAGSDAPLREARAAADRLLRDAVTDAGHADD